MNITRMAQRSPRSPAAPRRCRYKSRAKLLRQSASIQHPIGRGPGAAACWTALELARARLFGAPWDLLAHALYAHPLWIQPAELGGAFLVSFVLAAAAAAAGEAVVAPRTERLRALALGAALLALDA